jgi:hypothetical protein
MAALVARDLLLGDTSARGQRALREPRPSTSLDEKACAHHAAMITLPMLVDIRYTVIGSVPCLTARRAALATSVNEADRSSRNDTTIVRAELSQPVGNTRRVRFARSSTAQG